MKTHLKGLLILSLSALQFSYGQREKENAEAQEFPFTMENWLVENADSTESQIDTMVYKNKSAIKLEASQRAYLKNQKFKNFALEFYCNGLSGPGFGFRVQDKQNYEYLYLRLGASGKKDALQYLPIHNGNLPWQLYNYPKYEGNAIFPKEKAATFPLSMKDELNQGKASEKLINALAEKGFSFSKESEIIFGNEIVRYIFDQQKMEALLFEEVDGNIVFLDPRTWIHVKVEVVGKMASFYIEDMETPAFVVESLKGVMTEGGISLIGDAAGVHFADVSVMEFKESAETEGEPVTEELSENYLTKWEVSEMFAKDSVNFASQLDSIFQNKHKFKTVQGDEDGLINISRYYDDMTKTVVLTSNLESISDQTITLDFDYADHLVIFLNSEILFDQGMNFTPPPEKGEEGRVFVNDESVELNLKKGESKLVFVLSADNRQKFNWGFVAKLESLEGIRKD